MKDENLIHIKLEYGEALESKRDILSSEMNLLRSAKTAKDYHSLRAEELKIKIRLYQKIKEIVMSMKKMQTILPELKMPEVLKKEEQIEKYKNVSPKEKIYNSEIESELQEIQRKLKAIGE